jgi:peptide/nickel transport system substrate-binding protein
MSGSKRVYTIVAILIAMVMVASGIPAHRSGSVIQAQEESSIVIAIPEDPPSFNAAATDTGYDSLVMEMVLLGMADIDPDGNIFPELAAELPTIENGGVVIDEDNWTMTVTWKMRDDITWADGVPVTADDVIFTWDAIVDPEMGIWVPGWDYTDSVEKIDDYSFAVNYNYVYPGYLTQFGGETVAVWPAHYCDASQGFTAWDCGRNPLSDGPYLLDEWVTGDHMTFVRNPNYFEEGKPSIDKVIVQIVPEQPVRKVMLQEGDADVDMWLSETVLKELESDDRVNVTIAPYERWVMRLIPNLAARGSVDPVANPHPILSDVRVRRAMQMAIDVQSIADVIFHGYAKPVWTEFFRPPYACDVPQPAYDVEGAKKLLEEAGWIDEDGDGVRECHGCTTGAEDGYKMSMELTIYSEYGEELELTQQLIGEMFGEIGIHLDLSMLEGSIIWADSESGGTEQNGDFDLDMWDDGYAGIDPTDHIWYYYYIDAAVPDEGYNVMRWLNEDFSALLDEAYTLDEAYRKELFCQMADILAEEVPQILLFSVPDTTGYSTRLSGVQATVNDIITWNIADWQLVE